ncbi:MAG: hypothetical protein SGPRY_010314, partial [Prymnesium sp.]
MRPPLLLLSLSASNPRPRTPLSASLSPPGYSYAEGTPSLPLTRSAAALRHLLLQPDANQVEGALRSVRLAPAELSDLVDQLATRQRPLALRLLHSHANEGLIARSGSYSRLISLCRKAGEMTECMELLRSMHDARLRANPNTYLALIEALAKEGQLPNALQVYESMREVGAKQTNQTHTVMLSRLLRGKRTRDAARIARDLRSAEREKEYASLDASARNAMLQALLRAGDMGEARAVLSDLSEAGLKLSERTINVVLHGMLASGKCSQPTGWRNESSLADALDVFNEFAEGGGAGLITFNIMIDGFARKGQLVNVESLVAQLKRQGLLPNEYTFHALQRAAAVAQSPAHALEYFNMMCNAGVQANIRVWLLDPEWVASSISLTLLANALTKDGMGVEAVEIARIQVTNHSVELDYGCCSALLMAASRARAECCKEARDGALWLWGRMLDMPGHQPMLDSTSLCNLLRCLGRAGDFLGAREDVPFIMPARFQLTLFSLQIFERARRPRSTEVWQEMIK